jgi:hypothetical protein
MLKAALNDEFLYDVLFAVGANTTPLAAVRIGNANKK